MGRGIGRGIAVLLPVLLITTFITFLLGTVTGQDPAASVLGDNARPEDVARMRGVLGLDRPFIVRYWDWLWNVMHGDLGSSWFTHIPVADSVMQRLPVSLSIAFFALVLATCFGTVLGILAALSNGGIVDRAITLLASVLSTIPGFVAAIGLIVILSVTFPVFPSGGYVPPSDDPWMWIKCLTLPAIALASTRPLTSRASCAPACPRRCRRTTWSGRRCGGSAPGGSSASTRCATAQGRPWPRSACTCPS